MANKNNCIPRPIKHINSLYHNNEFIKLHFKKKITLYLIIKDIYYLIYMENVYESQEGCKFQHGKD